MQRTVLLAFGGLGLQGIPYARLTDFPDWQFVTFDAHAPHLPNLRVIDDRGWRPVDVMPACGRVITKPGYGTFAEACILGLPIVSLTRAGFAEAELLLAGLRDWAAHWIVEPHVFYHQPWDFLETPPTLPGRPAALGDATALIALELATRLGLSC